MGYFRGFRAAGWQFVVAVFIAAMLYPSLASACCTNLTCDYCVSSSSTCEGRCRESSFCVVTWTPTCNIFGCNCNNTGPTCQCGTRRDGNCVPVDCCLATSTAEVQERFKSADANGDGRISLDETKAWLQALGSNWAERFHGAGASADEKVLQQMFATMDTDHDAFISPGEFDDTLGGRK